MASGLNKVPATNRPAPCLHSNVFLVESESEQLDKIPETINNAADPQIPISTLKLIISSARPRPWPGLMCPALRAQGLAQVLGLQTCFIISDESLQSERASDINPGLTELNRLLNKYFVFYQTRSNP